MTNILPLLKRLEWCNRRDDGMQKCPECDEGYKYGHASSCQLAQAILEHNGETKIQKRH